MGSALPGEGRRGHRGGAAGQSRPRDSSDAGIVSAAFMEQQGLTQAQLADRLGVDRTYVSKVLSGSRQIRNVGRLRQVAGTIGVPPERFGLLPDPGGTALADNPPDAPGRRRAGRPPQRQRRRLGDPGVIVAITSWPPAENRPTARVPLTNSSESSFHSSVKGWGNLAISFPDDGS
jgi:transcriptional regulator with XRE-family HTH domain